LALALAIHTNLQSLLQQERRAKPALHTPRASGWRLFNGWSNSKQQPNNIEVSSSGLEVRNDEAAALAHRADIRGAP
jgi:hypothetical protein